MKRTVVSLAVAVGLVSTAHIATAAPFNSFDPRSMAMGGAGVAVGTGANAPFFNPALLAVTRDDEDFAWEIPTIGGSVRDPDDFWEAVQDFQDTDTTTVLQDALDAYNANPLDPSGTSFNTAPLETVEESTRQLSADFQSVSDKALTIGGGLGTVIGIPSRKFGAALSLHAEATVGSAVRYRDDALLQALADDVATYRTCLEQTELYYETWGADGELCNPATLSLNYVDTDPTSPTAGEVINFDPDSSIQSTVDVLGMVVVEAGVSLAREIKIAGSSFALGLKPKYVQVHVFDYQADVNSADEGDFDGSDYLATYNDFNMDIGLAKQFDNGFRTGFVVKNIISKEYEGKRFDVPTGNVVEIKPQVRMGVSHQTKWTTVALDVDVTENDPVGLEDPTQYAALGLELNFWDWVQLRGGYRMDMSNSDRSLMSFGVGLAPFSGLLHLDLAVVSEELNADTNEVGGALQLGMRF